VSEPTTVVVSDVRKAVVELLRGRAKKARFMTEVLAALQRAKISSAEIEGTLAKLETEGVVMIRDHFCADPHLAGVDLRIVAIVDGSADENPQSSAIHEIDNAWDKWLADYLMNHRCS
jgi:hypothetical protein